MAVTCGLPLNGAMASAINALDDVHGGAGQQCMELFAAIAAAAGDAEASADVIAAGLDALHRGARQDHPRLRPSLARRRSARGAPARAGARSRAGAASSRGRFARIAEGIERQLTARKGGRPIPMNIDGATAVIYCELGFAPELGRGLFILSRSVGILAHAWEQTQQGGRIKGPMSPDDSLSLHRARRPRTLDAEGT